MYNLYYINGRKEAEMRALLLAIAMTCAFSTLGNAAELPVRTDEAAFDHFDGWNDFCARNNGECSPNPKKDGHRCEKLTAECQAELEQVNTFVNGSIRYTPDQEHWGVSDRWEIPLDGKGECKAYALLKRHLLIERGWSRKRLALAYVAVMEIKGSDDHLVLIIKTDDDELILDHRSPQIKSASELAFHGSLSEVRRVGARSYVFWERQAYDDPNVWVRYPIPPDIPTPNELFGDAQ
jgi:predicted transglutaminase-like cysteine proteinase